MLRALLAFAMLLIAPAALAQSAPNANEAEAIRHAIDRGTLLYFYDQAAWHGTDDMLAKIGPRQGEIGGWIVDGPVEASELVFFDKNATDPRAVYVAQFRMGRLVSGRVLASSEDRTLSPARKQMVAALVSAREALAVNKVAPCGDKPFNTVVLPPEVPGGPTRVYFMTPQTKTNAYPMGGHFSFEVAANGKAGPMRRFTNGCLTIEGDPKKGKDPILFITHLLDRVPTEIHVFSAFAARSIVAVMTDKDRVWAIEIRSDGAHVVPLDIGAKK